MEFADGNDEMSQEYRPSEAYWQQELQQKRGLLMEEFKQADLNRD